MFKWAYFIEKFENFTFLGIKFEVYHYIIIKTYRTKFTSHSRFEISSSVDRGLTVIQFD